MQAQEYLQSIVNSIALVLTPDTYKSTEAMRISAGLARLCGASVELVFFYELPPPAQATVPSPTPLGLVPANVYESVNGEAESSLNFALETMSRLGVKAGGTVIGSFGGVGQLMDWIRLAKCNLIVVPEIRAKGFWALFRKSMAIEIVKHAESPVLVVHVPRNEKSRPRPRTESINRSLST